MTGRPKRLPRAIREQQMLDAAIDVFAEHGYHAASMNAIAARAEISKPMLYLYYGSKDELFASCIRRESTRFLDALTGAADPSLSPREQLTHGIRAFLGFVHENRQSWHVMYRQAMYQKSFADLVTGSRERAIELTALILRSSSREPHSNEQFRLMASALIGAGEAVADRIADGSIDKEAAVDLLVNLGWRGLAGKKPQ
ncbi:TetR/AcrR family transcriptional regulator [Hoyosella subflava]|uniref:TetR family transcriptional regulator n=1 Tax=Hoyosella subflava (strain DSM 45089 / JCM 17490 / NBRC 109087 / DQS3-9A1) TaxID=443218 RepID=F6EJD2_HOYSD|nr:TetR/AcrR family transcriptional regulator [Hoyosella subflava]AEF42548.1 TetR family transcriptional regulator [Hoyosella subflava DQS3-9A1]